MDQLFGIICCYKQQIMALLCDLRRISAQDINVKIDLFNNQTAMKRLNGRLFFVVQSVSKFLQLFSRDGQRMLEDQPRYPF